ncbi:malate dehydrogenase, mitochondrial-like isoform X2 [Vanessa cardui]|uniref:malate dehydrogenase, mitochondrial-like isoform X2 n=1 Tax=Vanessa cardui TaxID=171605 RepID=UPI001F12E084|nr:malate dehydrogenase, mitochondrial-like isoform X2 [Vanessa cardui]
MNPLNLFSKAKIVWVSVLDSSRILTYAVSTHISHRGYAKKGGDECRRACVDIPPDVDHVCPLPCERRKKKKEGILHKIKLKIVEGGTNFGTPFRNLQCKDKVCKEVEIPEPKALAAPVKKVPSLPPPRPGVQVAVLGADTNLGQYIALLLKQCPCIKKLRLYEATDTKSSEFTRNLCNVVQDLQHIDTNCLVEAYSCNCNDLERCLQNSNIVLMLDSACVNTQMPLEKRFECQAPAVKRYADIIAKECPNAFIIVCTSPIDCMVPLIAETLKETGWYNPRKLLGSLAVPEMRASTLAARALCLEPCYVHVPCVGGTEGLSLVPLFSKALEYFDFSEQNAELMTQTVRCAPITVGRCDGQCNKSAELSEAHALAGLVTKVAWALLCKDVPRVSGFVEIDPTEVISPTRFIASPVEMNGSGIVKCLGLPKMTDHEMKRMDLAFNELYCKCDMVENWYCKYCSSSNNLSAYQLQFFIPKSYQHFDDCAYANL